MFNFRNIIDDDQRWFLRWLTLRTRNKKLEFENGALKSEVDHLNHLLGVYRQDEEFRLTKILKDNKKINAKARKNLTKKEIKRKKKEKIKFKNKQLKQ